MTPEQSAAVARLREVVNHGDNMVAITFEYGRTLLAALDEAQADAARFNGENAVLLGLLTECNSVLRTIDPDDCDEAENLADLRHAIYCAQATGQHKGALL